MINVDLSFTFNILKFFGENKILQFLQFYNHQHFQTSKNPRSEVILCDNNTSVIRLRLSIIENIRPGFRVIISPPPK